MELQTQVCSLDLAKRLKELGVKKESVFAWRGTKQGMQITFSADFSLQKNDSIHGVYPAFTVAELGEMLPIRFSVGNRQVAIFSYRENEAFCCALKDLHSKIVEIFTADTEADARAKMLIYLLENGLLKSQGAAGGGD
jgi:hypothetical protein